MDWVSKFAELARMNNKRAMQARRNQEPGNRHYFQGRAYAYLTAARMVKAVPSKVVARRVMIALESV